MQVFDPQKQTLLRQLKGHQRPVHTTCFAPDKMHVLSGSDDATVSARTHDTGSLELGFPGLLPRCACTHPYRSVYAGSSKACWWMVISLWQHIFADAFPLLHCCMLICADTAGPTRRSGGGTSQPESSNSGWMATAITLDPLHAAPPPQTPGQRVSPACPAAARARQQRAFLESPVLLTVSRYAVCPHVL